MKSSVARLRSIVLLIGDLFSFALGLFAALALRYGFPIPQNQLELHRFPFALIFTLWVVSFFIAGLYSLRTAKNNRAFFALFSSLFAMNAAIAVGVFYFAPQLAISPKIVLFLDLLFTAVVLTGWRILFNAVISLPPLALAIVGAGKEVNELIAYLEKHPQQGYKCVLHFDHVAGDFAQQLKKHGIDTVVVAIDYRRSPEAQKYLFECIPLHIRFVEFVDFYEQHFQKIPLAVIDRAWFLENLNEPGKQFFSLMKRTADLFITIVLGVIGIVLTPFIVVAIWIDSGAPALFSQTRVGQFGASFNIYKFRSMQAERVTQVGGFLRATHLDEIPQLWNILKGEMSFVGPRPEQLALVTGLTEQIPFYAERLLVPPGITGWAQLHEPHAKAEDALGKLQYDLFYIKHRSPLLDLEIILKTLRVLL